MPAGSENSSVRRRQVPSKETASRAEPSPKGGSLAIGEKGISPHDHSSTREPVDVEFPPRRLAGHFVSRVDPAIKTGRPRCRTSPTTRPIDRGDARRQFVGLVRPEGRWDAANRRSKNVPGLDIAHQTSTARDSLDA